MVSFQDESRYHQSMKHPILFVGFLAIVLTSCDLALPSLVSSSTSEGESSSSLDVPSSSLSSASSPSEDNVSSLSTSTDLPDTSSSLAESSSVSPTSSSSLLSSLAPSVSSSQPLVTIASNASQYYQSISPSLSGEALKNALDLLISGNVRVSYDWSRFESADESLTETNKVITIYPRRNYLKTAHVSGNAGAHWNREHTYPQSKISGAAVNDNHHIFADDWKTNGARSNYRFGIVNPTEANRVKDSSGLNTDNYEGGGFFLPNDTAKGEVARATLYMNTLYGYTLEGNFQTSELAVLWALQYPPTNRDMQRNNRVYTNQGNRNPYVDHASYICLVYGMTSVATRQACGLA